MSLFSVLSNGDGTRGPPETWFWLFLRQTRSRKERWSTDLFPEGPGESAFNKRNLPLIKTQPHSSSALPVFTDSKPSLAAVNSLSFISQLCCGEWVKWLNLINEAIFKY